MSPPLDHVFSVQKLSMGPGTVNHLTAAPFVVKFFWVCKEHLQKSFHLVIPQNKSGSQKGALNAFSPLLLCINKYLARRGVSLKAPSKE